ncbi:AF17 protein, partial [Polypterus senegalus]
MREMVGGCCVCSDERGWTENPLVYCDGHGCSVAVHQACYGIVQVPTGPWFCRKCESQERAARVRCELCPHKDGALKRTDNGGWAHVVCALYIPEVQFANVLTMEPIVLQYVPHERYNKALQFTAFLFCSAQMAGLLCEEEGLEADNVKYCGYCKYHYNKMKKSRQSCSSSGSALCHTRSSSTSPSLEKHSSHHDKQKKSHKDKGRQKEKHKKSSETLPTLLPGSTDKVSSSHHSSSKESVEVSRSEAKSRKMLSHVITHRGRKSSSGKSFSSNGPFQQALSTPESTHSSPCYDVTGSNSGNSFEPKVTISTFGSIMRITSTGLGNSSKVRDNSPGEYKVVNPVSSQRSKRRPPVLDEDSGEDIPVKVRKHRGSRKSKHGPGRPKGSKNKESRENKDSGQHSSVSSTLTSLGPPSLMSPVSSTSRPPLSSSGYPSSSRTYTPGGSTNSSLLGSGIYTSNKDPISLGGGGGILGAFCSTPLSSSLLGHQGASSSIPQLNCLSLPSALPTATPASVSTTQVFSLPGSSYSLNSSRVFGSPLTSGPSINPLISQSESSLQDPELEDCPFACRDSSPRESLSSPSPISSLPLLFDQRDIGSRSSGENTGNIPACSAHIEQLLEKHGSGEMGFNIVEMLKSLHSLQQENQRLQDQIMSLTAKKERLQLLNVQLEVPFNPVQSSTTRTPCSSSSSTQMNFLSTHNACATDPLGINKSSPSKTAFLAENSISASSEELHSGCQSRSSSSLSFHSTPPPQQSPASLSQPLVNGLGRNMVGSTLGVGTSPANSSLTLASGLMANLNGGPQLSVNGMMGNLNGVIQTPANSVTQQTLQQNLQFTNSLSGVPGANLLTEQQKQFVLQQQQQLHQILASQQFTPEQQAVVYQMLQQNQRQRLQLAGAGAPPFLPGITPALASTLAPSSHLMSPATASPLNSNQGNPFLGLTQDGNVQKVQVCFFASDTHPIPEPKIAAKHPYKVDLEAGKRYSWCACGHSMKQPFCDGTHKKQAPGLSPVRFTLDEAKTVWLCGCKRTQNAPYCDGTHKSDLVQSNESGLP